MEGYGENLKIKGKGLVHRWKGVEGGEGNPTAMRGEKSLYLLFT